MSQPAHVPLSALKGVGPKLADKLERLGLTDLQALLFHLPFRYQDRTRVTPIGALRAGMETAIRGSVELADVVFRGRRSLLCRVADGTGFITVRFFYFSAAQQAQWTRGRQVQCFGEVRWSAVGLEMVHPEYSVYEGAPPALGDRLTPVYPTTEGVQQATLRKLVDQALTRFAATLPELLPPQVRALAGDYELSAALQYLHRPPTDAAIAELEQGSHPAQRRLAFEELLAHHLSLRQLRHRARNQRAPVVKMRGASAAQLRSQLPYALTHAQTRVLTEIGADLARATPMQRLVQGDVGCGKTIVAALAALDVIDSGLQVAVMAPTELLAEQHAQNFANWFAPLGVRVVWLAGKLNARAKRLAHEQIAGGEAQLAVGTHALFQAEVKFARLGLMVVDEQHRFGVDQRLALREKGRHGDEYPHQLVMSATPIPRTLAQTLYGDLDVSIIDELPPGRTPVQTASLPEARRAQVVERIRAACKAGRQAYWVCPLIEESDALQLQTATETHAEVSAALPELRVALVHGRMKSAQKEATMRAFKSGEIHLLVATTVIEVGVDVPNASLMVIENAERLGLSQLHQLRGRVGRGSDASSCVLLYRSPLSQTARARLACMRETHDGFEIARRDLELRGPGEMFGIRQTGLANLRVADLVRDQALLPKVAQAAEVLLRDHPDNIAPLIARWLGYAERYGQV